MDSSSGTNEDVVLEVDLTTGNVQVQRLMSDNTTWVTVENDDNANITAPGLYRWPKSNNPLLRIIATGDAKFSINE